MSYPGTIAIQTAFNLVGSAPKFNITDTTDLVGDGITVSAFKGLIKIQNPLGVTVYNNTDINNPDLYTKSVTSIERTSSVASVTCTSHGMSTGDKVLISGANQSAYNGVFEITKVNNNLFTYTVSGSPATPATGAIFATKMSLNSVSIPVIQGTTKPIPGNYSVTLTTIISSGTGAGTYINPFVYTYGYIRPVVSISQAVDIYIPKYISIDTTTYDVNGVSPSLSRTHTIVFPTDSGIPSENYVTQTVTIFSPKVWNGVYQTNIVTNLSYTFSDNLVVIDRVYGTKPFVVAANGSLMQITTVLNNYNEQYKSLQSENPFQASEIYAIIDRTNQLLTLYNNNVMYGNTDAANQNLSDIYQILNVTPQLSGQVIPSTGIIGKTILLWSDFQYIGFSQDDYVDYNNTLYRVLSDTLPGESPDTNPEKFQLISGAQPTYLTYQVLLTQSGTDDPVANVLFNNTGEDFVWTRIDVGNYNVQTPYDMNADKIAVIPGIIDYNDPNISGALDDSNDYIIFTYASGVFSDNVLSKTFLEFRFYQ